MTAVLRPRSISVEQKFHFATVLKLRTITSGSKVDMWVSTSFLFHKGNHKEPNYEKKEPRSICEPPIRQDTSTIYTDILLL